MKSMIVAALAALLLAGCSTQASDKAEAADSNGVATASARPSDADSEAYMHDAERAWTALAVKPDPDLLNRILADDYVGVSASGTVRDKKAQIADENATSGTLYAASKLDYIHYRHFGDTVIAQGAEYFTAKPGGTDRHLAWTDVWMFRDGKWQIVASQTSAIAPAAAK